ncbi:MAG TPA: hypothetical protein VLC09_21105 [Polyangiaceae bacterium]|nr:hypothetical protein [Polyangiaceae bacterium]
MSPRGWLLVAVALGGTSSLGACTSVAEQRVELARLGGDCRIDSDCSEQLICAFEVCHQECTDSRDCEEGALCVAGDRPNHVCQLPDNRSCSTGEDGCAGEQLCAVDALCRDACRTERDCVAGQRCVRGACAEPSELSDGELVASPDRDEQLPLPCRYNSDCPEAELCRSGTCELECTKDEDCPSGRSCEAGRCRVIEPDCIYHSDCEDDRICASGECVAPPPEPACEYHSDCPAKGQDCEAGACVCACSTDADCSTGQRCADGCECVPDSVWYGAVDIQDSAGLRAMANVVEIRGNLKIALTGPEKRPFVLPSLQRVTNLEVTGTSTSSASFPALEEVTGTLQVGGTLTELSTPQLTSVAALNMVGATKLISVDFSALTSAGSMNLQDLYALESLEFPVLTELSQSVYVFGAAGLTSMAFPQLVHMQSFTVVTAGALASLSLPQLQTAEQIALQSSQLVTLVLPSLTSAGSLSIRNNPQLQTISCPLLAALENTYGPTELLLEHNPQLVSFSLPALLQVADVVFNNNAKLPSCDIDTWLGTVTVQTATNTNNQVCP